MKRLLSLCILLSLLFLSAYAKSIAKYQYWIDEISSIQEGTVSGNSFTEMIPTEGLLPGSHFLSVRFQDDSGIWSVPQSYLFFKDRTQKKPANSITRCEYWIDDISNKKEGIVRDGIFAAQLDMAELKPGVHYLSFRAQDDLGQWSSVSTRTFFKEREAHADNRINGYQYWFNDNIGDAITVSLPLPTDSYELDTQLDLSNLTTELTRDNLRVITNSKGKQVLGQCNTLNFRFRDNNQGWSTLRRDTFNTVVSDDVADLSFMIANNNATQGTNGWTATGVRTESGQHWSDPSLPYFSIGSPNVGTWSSTMSQKIPPIPSGDYILYATIRGNMPIHLSVDNHEAEFTGHGSVGGQIWEESAEDSAERAVNDGKGFGWERVALPFSTDGTGVTLTVSASVKNSWGFWCNIGDFRLIADLTANITVEFDETTDISRYRDMRLMLLSQSGSKGITMGTARSYTFGGLSTNTSYDLCLRNRYGHNVAVKENISPERGKNSVRFDSFAPLRTVNVNVADPSGKDISEAVKISWRDASGEEIASGRTLSDIPDGAVMRMRIMLPDSLASRFAEQNVEFTAGESTATQNITLSAMKPMEVIGKVIADYSPAQGAAVLATQKLNGRSDYSVSATADLNGNFKLPLFNDSCNIIVSYPGFLDLETRYDGFPENTDIGEITLEPISVVVIVPEITYYASVAEGEEAAGKKLYTIDDLEISAIKIGSVTDNLTLHVQRNGLIIVPDAKVGDRIELIATSRKDDFVTTSATLTIAESDSTKVDLTLVQFGALKTTFSSSANEASKGLLFDSNGIRVASQPFVGNTVTFKSLHADKYTLISMGSSALLDTPLSLESLGKTGLSENMDYSSVEVEITDGRISTVNAGVIPSLDEKQFYYTTEDTRFNANKKTLRAGDYITIETKISFKPEYLDEVSDLKLVVDIPEGCSYVDKSAIIGRISAACTFDGAHLEIPLDKEKLGERIRFCLIPETSGTYNPSANIDFMLDEQRSQPIGSVEFEAESATLTVPQVVDETEFVASGIAAPGSQVKVKDNGNVIGTAKAQSDGHWHTRCRLGEVYNLSTHPIQAEIITSTGNKATTDIHNVEYNVTANSIKSVTMTNYSHRNGIGNNPFKEETVFDFKNPSTIASKYWYWPRYPQFTFKIDLKENSPEIVSGVRLAVKTTDGKQVDLTPEYDAKSDRWVASAEFQSHSLPVDVGVSFMSNDTIVIDNRPYDTMMKELNDIIAYKDSVTAAFDAITVPTVEQIMAADNTRAGSSDGISGNPVFDKFVAEMDQFFVEEDGNPNLVLPQRFLDCINDFVQAETPEEVEAAEKKILYETSHLDDGTRIDFEDINQSSLNPNEEFEYSSEDYNVRQTKYGLVNESQLMSEGYEQIPSLDGKTKYFKPSDGGGSYIDPARGIRFDYEDLGVKAAVSEPDFLNNAPTYIPEMSENIKLSITGIYSTQSLIAVLRKWHRRCSHDLWMKSMDMAINERKTTGKFSQSSIDKMLKIHRLRKNINTAFYSTLFGKAVLRIRPNFDKYNYALDIAMNLVDVSEGINEAIRDDAKLRNLEGDLYLCTVHTDENEEDIHKRISIARLNNFFRALGHPSATMLEAGILGKFTAAGKDVILGAKELFKIASIKTVSIGLQGWFKNKREKEFRIEYDNLNNLVDWKKCRREKPWLFDPEWSGCKSAEPVQDPSGYVYEAVTSNRLDGVTATIYTQETSSDMYGDSHVEIKSWKADEYSQINPQLTDASGVYAWDVPSGMWQVRFTKPGYEPASTEWLPVPPPQLDINVAMSHAVNPSVEKAEGYESGVSVIFDKYMIPECMADTSIVIKRESEIIEGHIEAANLEKDPYTGISYASIYRFVPKNLFKAGETVEVNVANGVKSYADMPLLEDWKAETIIMQEIHAIDIEPTLSVKPGETRRIKFTVLPVDAAQGRNVTISNVAEEIVSINVSNIVVGNDGSAEFDIAGLIPGNAPVILSVTGTDISAELLVTVGDNNGVIAAPQASIPTGSQVDSGTPVVLSCATEGAAIFYTLDGRCPCDEASRIRYNEPIIITGSTHITAMAVKEGLEDSPIVDFEYSLTDDSGIYSTTVGNTSVIGGKGDLHINGCSDTDCSVYNLRGIRVWYRSGVNGDVTISLPAGEVYVVRLEEKGACGVTKVTL